MAMIILASFPSFFVVIDLRLREERDVFLILPIMLQERNTRNAIGMKPVKKNLEFLIKTKYSNNKGIQYSTADHSSHWKRNFDLIFTIKTK